jgi:hypothetical protein
VMNQLTAMPALVEVAAGSLDDVTRFKPTISIFTSSAPPWALIPADIPRYPKAPG